jgi:hypothetical protein
VLDEPHPDTDPTELVTHDPLWSPTWRAATIVVAILILLCALYAVASADESPKFSDIGDCACVQGV